NWTGGEIDLSNAAILTNSGTFNIQSDAGFVSAGGAASILANTGTITKTSPVGIGKTTVSTLFNNSGGTVHVTSGVLEFQGGGTSTGTFDSAVSGIAYSFTFGTQTLNSGAAFTGTGCGSVDGGT